jgi:hypothetical protein
MKEKKTKIENLINEEINKLVTEQDYGAEYDSLGGIYGDYYDSMGYGGGGGGGKAGGILDVLPIGIVPRVAKTLVWGVENMTQRVFGLLKTMFAYVSKAFIPGLSAINDYKQIRENEIQGLEKIDKKYADVLSANLEVLKNLDAWGIVFLLDPTLGLGWRLAENTPTLAMTLLDALTAGKASELLESYMATNKIQTKNLDQSTTRFFSQIGFTDFGLSEQVQDTKQSSDVIKQFFSSKEVNQAINSSGVVPKVRTFARKSIISRINKIQAAKTVEELMQTAPEVAKQTKTALGQLLQQAQQNKLNQNEIIQAKTGLLGQIKEQAKKIAIDNLTKTGQQDKKIGTIISGLIKQIKAMK